MYKLIENGSLILCSAVHQSVPRKTCVLWDWAFGGPAGENDKTRFQSVNNVCGAGLGRHDVGSLAMTMP